jgi:integrase
LSTGGRVTRKQVVYAGKPVPGLFERKTGDGRHVYELRKKVRGRAVRRTLKATTATDAIREARAEVAKLDAGVRLVGRTDVSLRELRDEWEEWAKGPATTLSPQTVACYLDRLDGHVLRQLGGETKAAAITPAYLRTMIDRLRAEKLSGSPGCGCVTATAALLRLGVRRGLLDKNPARMLEHGDRPSSKRRTEPRYLDRKQIDRLLGKLSDDFRPVAATLAFAGLRVSEALALRWRDIDFDTQMLDVHGTKTAASAASVPLIADLVTELRSHRSRVASVSLARVKPDAPVFSTRNGLRHHRKNLLRAIYAAGDAARLNPKGKPKVGCHSLRHSCAGLLLAARVPAPRVAEILRHGDTRTLLTTYAGLVESQRGELLGDLEAAFAEGR